MNWNSFSGTLTEETRLNELQFGLITNRDFKYLPTAYCYYGYPQPANPDCWADSNGCAAGNILEEAILQDAMELVERDSIALYPQSTDRLAFHWWQTATVENQPYLIPSADYS